MGVLFGASALPLYSLCVAHANDRADPSSYIEVSSLLLLAFGIGATVGPFTSALLIASVGLGALFAFTAGIHLLVAVFALYRIRSVEAAPMDERTVFAGHPPMGHGTQAMIELTPAAESSADGSESRPVEAAASVRRPT